MSSSTPATTYFSKRTGRVDDELLRIARTHKGNEAPYVECDDDGFESFNDYMSQWLAIEEEQSSPVLSPGDKEQHNVDVLGFTYPRRSYELESEDGQPERPLERGIDVDVSEYEIETDSNASTPPHIREQRERELEEMRLEEERKHAEAERRRIEEEEKKKAEEERKRMEEEQRKAEEERKRLEEEQRIADEARKAEEERLRAAEEERLRAEEEERKCIAEEEAAAARAKKEELKARVKSVLAEESVVPERRNSSWTRAEAKRSILKIRHSIHPMSVVEEPQIEKEKSNDEANKENHNGDLDGLVDYESDGSAISRRISIRSTRTRRESVFFTAKSKKRVSIARGTQPEIIPLVDYDQTPAAKSGQGTAPRFSLPYDSASSFQTTPGSRRGSVGDGVSNSVRKRLDVDLGDVGVPESKLQRFRRQSEVCAPARTMEKGTLCRESLGSPELISKRIPKVKNMVDCAIMCRGEEIDAEIAIMFGEFKLTTSGGVDIPPVEKPQETEPTVGDESMVDDNENGNAGTPAKEVPESEPEPTPEPPKPKVTFVEQAISVQTPGKTVTHKITESILEDEPASALRDNERMVLEFGEEDEARVRVVEIVEDVHIQTPGGEEMEEDDESQVVATPDSVAATFATSRRASIATLPSNPTPTKKNRGSVASPSVSTAADSERKARLIVSSAKPPKSPRAPSLAGVSSSRRTRRSLRFAHTPSPQKPEASPVVQPTQQPIASPESHGQESSPAPGKAATLDYAEAENLTPNLQAETSSATKSMEADKSPRIDSVIKCASFAIPQNRLSMQKGMASSGNRRTRSSKKSKPTDEAGNVVFDPIPFDIDHDIAIQSNVVELEITEKERRRRASMARTRRSPRSSRAGEKSIKCTVVPNVLSFHLPSHSHVADIPYDGGVEDDDIDNGDIEDEFVEVEPPKRKSTRSRKSSARSKAASSEVESRTTRSMASRRGTSSRAKNHANGIENVSTISTRSRTRSQKSKESNSSPDSIKNSPDVTANGKRKSSRRGSGASSKNTAVVVEEEQAQNVPNGRRKSTRRTRGSSSTVTPRHSLQGEESVGSSSRRRTTRRSPTSSRGHAEEVQIPEPPVDDFEHDVHDDEDDAQIPVGSPIQLLEKEVDVPRVSDEEIQEVLLSTSEQKSKKRSAVKRGRKRDRQLKRELANLELPEQDSDEEDGGRRVRRGKRARFQPLKYWENEKPVYERRDSQIMPTIKLLKLAIDPREAGKEQKTVEVPDEPVLVTPTVKKSKDDEFVVDGDPLSPEEDGVVEVPIRTRKSTRKGSSREASSSSSAAAGPWKVTPEKEQPAKKRRKRRKRY